MEELEGLEDNIGSDSHSKDLEHKITLKVVSESLSLDTMRMMAQVDCIIR